MFSGDIERDSGIKWVNIELLYLGHLWAKSLLIIILWWSEYVKVFDVDFKHKICFIHFN